MRRIIAVIDPDVDYAQRLADYINKHEIGGLKAVTFSNTENYKVHAHEYDTRIMLIDEGECSRMKDDIRSVVICLSEDCFASSSNITICKYSRADHIVRRMLEKYNETAKDVLARTSINRSHIIMIYSPLGRCGKTTFAITMANYLGSQSKCLLLCLDEFCGIFRFIAEEAVIDFSDVINAFMKGKYSWALFSQSICHFGNTDYIAPVRYPEDAGVLNADQLTDLIESIADESGYENIVIDVGDIGRKATDFIELADEIFVPSNPKNNLKVEEFENCLKASGREDVFSRLRMVELPFEEKYETAMLKEDDYSYGSMRDYTRNLFSYPEQSVTAAD